jgi:hypothetical protein
MKMQTASESLGWMDSVGPVTVAPGRPRTADVGTSKGADHSSQADAGSKGTHSTGHPDVQPCDSTDSK